MFKYFEINENNNNIRCKIYCDKIQGIKKIVVACHGFAGHKDNKSTEKLAERITSKHKDTALIIFDLPCHGEDVKKKLLLTDCLEYLHIVIGYVKKQYNPTEIHSFAVSFGAYLVLLYMEKYGNPFSKIIFRCPAITMYETLKNKMTTEDDWTLLMKGKPAFVGFDRKVEVTKSFFDDLKENDILEHDFLDVAENMIIIHGEKDEVIDFETVRDFADRNCIEFYPVPTGDHRFQNQNDAEYVVKVTTEKLFTPSA